MNPRMFKECELRFENEWPKLKVCIENIMSLKTVSSTVWRNSFSQTFSLCVSFEDPSGPKIYEGTKKHLEDLLASFYEETACSVDLLATYYKWWNVYYKGLHFLDNFLRHVNVFYVQRELYRNVYTGYGTDQVKKILEIHELGLCLWKKYLILPLSEKLAWAVAEELKNDRSGKCENPVVLQTVVRSLIETEASNENPIELYKEILEKHILIDTREYYRMRASEEIQKGDCSQYMEKALQWMNEEKMRSLKFLHRSSVEKVQNECLKSVAVDHLEYLHSEFKKLIPQEVKEDYKNVYALLKNVQNGFDSIATEFQAYLTKVGCNAMSNVTDNNPEAFVDGFLQVREIYLNLIKECFDSHKKFVDALDKACVVILKCDGHKFFAWKASQLLSSYCDRFLKKNAKASGETDAERELSRAIIVFGYLQDRDIFQKVYCQKLVKRLLHGISESLYAEESMIAKLRQVCGSEFTKKYQHMFTDMNLRKGLNEEFHKFTQENAIAFGFHFEAAILRMASWPCYPKASFSIPQVLENCITQFEKFYTTKYNGRKLVWVHHLASAELKLCYLSKPYAVSMTTHQMAILLLFEHSDQVTYSEMKDSTKLEDAYLCKVIRSLTESKLIISVDKNADDLGSVYDLNKKFSNNRTKFRIPATARKDRNEVSKEEIQKIRKSADCDRRMALDAAIIRIMKARKVVNHNALIEEVINQVKDHFLPNVSLIKKCIDGLLEREYMKRNAQCASEYLYIV